MDRCCERKCRRKRKAEAKIETWIISIDKNLGKESAERSQHSQIMFISQVAPLLENIDFFESHIHWKCFCANNYIDINRSNNSSLLLRRWYCQVRTWIKSFSLISTYHEFWSRLELKEVVSRWMILCSCTCWVGLYLGWLIRQSGILLKIMKLRALMKIVLDYVSVW